MLKAGESYSSAMVLKEYFGQKEGQTVMEFGQELKALSDSEKTELATEAAKQLGVSLK